MKRESLPLVLAILIPFVLVLIVIFYNYGFDITVILRKIDILYYIIVIPFVLGFIVTIVKLIRPSY